jgi:hypothetical protein
MPRRYNLRKREDTVKWIEDDTLKEEETESESEDETYTSRSEEEAETDVESEEEEDEDEVEEEEEEKPGFIQVPMPKKGMRVTIEIDNRNGDYDEDEDETLTHAQRGGFEREARRFADMQGYSVDWDSVERLDDRSLINGVSQLAPFDPASKQALLEAETLTDRCELLVQLMQFFGRTDGSEEIVTLQ